MGIPDLERGAASDRRPDDAADEDYGSLPVSLGTLLGVAALARLTAVGFNFWLYCYASQDGQCHVRLPDISTIGGHNGTYGQQRFMLAVATTWANDACSLFVLSVAYDRIHSAGKDRVPGLFKAILFTSSFLDGAQAATPNFQYHWLMIQVAGFLCWVVLVWMAALLWTFSPDKAPMALYISSGFLFCLSALFLGILWLYHQGQSNSRLWVTCEYVAMVCFTGVLIFMGSVLPKSRLDVDFAFSGAGEPLSDTQASQSIARQQTRTAPRSRARSIGKRGSSGKASKATAARTSKLCSSNAVSAGGERLLQKAAASSAK